MMFEEEDFFDNTYKEDVKEEVKPFITREERLEKRELYQGKKEPSYVESVSKPYANTNAKSYYDNKERETMEKELGVVKVSPRETKRQENDKDNQLQ